jgi:hypothetical protein
MIRHTSPIKEIALTIKNFVAGEKSVCRAGVAEAITTAVAAEAFGVGACVSSVLVTGLGGVAVDTERTTFARPTIIVQTLFSGWAAMYFKIAMYSSSEDRS